MISDLFNELKNKISEYFNALQLYFLNMLYHIFISFF